MSILLISIRWLKQADFISAKKRAKLHKKNEMGKKITRLNLFFMFFYFLP